MADLPLLTPDTFADKVARFCMGAVLGIIAGWCFSLYGGSPESARGFVALLGGSAIALGIVAVVGGNRAIEWLIERVWS